MTVTKDQNATIHHLKLGIELKTYQSEGLHAIKISFILFSVLSAKNQIYKVKFVLIYQGLCIQAKVVTIGKSSLLERPKQHMY